MALVDARRRGIDDHEHLCRKIFAPPVEDHARHIDRFGFFGMRTLVELQRREPMLPIDDQEFLLRRLQFADRTSFIQRLEAQLLRRKQQDCAGDRRLRDCRLVEIANLFHFRARKLPLKCFFVALDAGDELRHVIVFSGFLGRDRSFLAVEAADEPHLFQQFFRWISREVKNRVLLPNPCRNHRPRFGCGSAKRSSGKNAI